MRKLEEKFKQVMKGKGGNNKKVVKLIEEKEKAQITKERVQKDNLKLVTKVLRDFSIGEQQCDNALATQHIDKNKS